MKQLLLLTLLFIGTLQLNAQCEIPFADFENWHDATTTFNGEFGTNFEEGTILWPDENAVGITRLIFIFFGAIDLAAIQMNTPIDQQNEQIFGFDRTTDSRTGEYAFKLGGDTNLGLSDLFYFGECNDMIAPSYFSFYYKHVGNFNDSLYINISMGADSIVAVDSLEDQKIGAYFSDSIFVTEDIQEWQFMNIPVVINNDQVSLDSIDIILLRLGEVSADNYFIIDNIQWNIETPVIDYDNEVVFQLGQSLNNTEIYPYFNEKKYAFKSYSIYDQQGRLITSKNTLDKAIDISQYSPGTYYYQINATEGSYTKPFIRL